MNQTITLPREVAAAIAQILIDAKTGECDYQDGRVKWSIDQLAAALEQPQRKLTSQEIADSALLGNIESQFNACMHQEHCKRWKAQAGLQHQHESRHINDLATKTSHSVTTCSTVPEGWKMVPVEPTDAMLDAAISVTPDADVAYKRMLAAAPQPPTVKECLTVEQPQGEQAQIGSHRDAQEVPFEAWWEKHGQFLRTGGGQYEKTFAWHAWCEATKKPQPPVVDHPEPAYLLRDLADDISVDALELIAAIRDAGLGDYSINMRLPARVCVAMCKRFADVGRRPVARVAGTGHLGGHFDWCVPGNQGVPRGTLLYTRPQPQRDPLTDEEIDAIADAMPGGLEGFLKGWGWRQFARAVLAAAPQPPIVKECLTVERKQGEQEPVAWIENVGGGVSYNPYHEAARKLPDGVRFDLYTHQQNLRCKSNQARLATLWGYEKKQPPRQPLTDEQIAAATGAKPGTPIWLVAVAFTRATEAAHGIGGEA